MKYTNALKRFTTKLQHITMINIIRAEKIINSKLSNVLKHFTRLVLMLFWRKIPSSWTK